MSFSKLISSSLTAILFLCAGSGNVVAQAPAAAATSASKEKERGPAVKALLLVSGAPNIELVAVVGEKISAPFNVGASGLSPSFFPGARSFNLAVKDASAKNGIKNVSAVVLPESGNDFLLLLEPAENKTLVARVVNDRQDGFGADATLFFNASATPIGAVLANKKTLIEPRRVEIVAAPAKENDVPFYQVELYHPDNGKPKLFASSRWLHRADGRNYVFIYQEKETARFVYQTFSETFAVKR